MIYIDRTGYHPAAAWIARADDLTQQLLVAADGNARNQIIDDNQALWGELKDFLLSISNDKCWYSESKDSYNHLHVDHFRPKKVAIGIDGKDQGGYWWLAFTWENYRACGGVGNVRKKDKFPVKKNKANAPGSSLDDEFHFFLDPCEEEDVLKITFIENGEVIPIERAGWDFERADYTIKNLNLNFKKLKARRQELWVKCSILIDELTGLMQKQNEADQSGFRKGQIKEKMKQLKDMVNPKSPFSATAKACIYSKGVKWAYNVLA